MKRKIFNIIAFISCIGIIMFIATDFFGGMPIWFLSYWFLIIPILLLYIVSCFDVLICLLTSKYNLHKTKINIHLSTLILIIAFIFCDPEYFKAKKIAAATLKDDLFHYTLVLREKGCCEIKITGFIGYDETINGSYNLKGDTIIFSKVPYNNEGFIPDTILWDKKEKAIFINKDDKGNFIRKKEYLSYFEIDSLDK